MLSFQKKVYGTVSLRVLRGHSDPHTKTNKSRVLLSNNTRILKHNKVMNVGILNKNNIWIPIRDHRPFSFVLFAIRGQSSKQPHPHFWWINNKVCQTNTLRVEWIVDKFSAYGFIILFLFTKSRSNVFLIPELYWSVRKQLWIF